MFAGRLLLAAILALAVWHGPVRAADEDLEVEDGVALIGIPVSLAMTWLNLRGLNRGEPSVGDAVIGLVAGGVTTAVGASLVGGESSADHGLGWVAVSAGGVCVLASAWALWKVQSTSKKEHTIQFDFLLGSTASGGQMVGLVLQRRP